MASSGSPAHQVEEMTHLKALYGDKCRVIDNVGDFTHVVSIKRNSTDLAYKFQIEASYPKIAPHIIIKSSHLSESDCERLTSFLSCVVTKNTNLPILQKLVSEADNWIKSQDLQYVFETQVDSDDGKRSKKKGKKKKPSKKSDDTDSMGAEKKSSMKTASDVIKRIQWDGQLPAECFAVAYLDRFVGIVEKQFDAFSWEDLASADIDDLAIPQHRIQYFKYKNQKVWDKNKRLDDMFGSTGSGKTIMDVISNYKDEDVHAARGADDGDESDSDDDVQIVTGFTSDMKVPQDEAGVVNTPTHEAEHNAESQSSKPELRGRETYWGQKSRPTHFLCLRIVDPEIVEAVKGVHDVVKELAPEFESSFIPADMLHITLACVGLDDNEAVNKATRALYNMREELQGLNPQNIKVELEGTDNFFHNVLYAKLKPNSAFMSFAEHVQALLTNCGIEIRDVFDFTPHMTLLKFKKQTQKELKTHFALDARICSAVEHVKFGAQSVDNVYLCEMSNTRGATGFYVTPGNICFFGSECDLEPAEW